MGETVFAERADLHQAEFDARFSDIVSQPELSDLGEVLTTVNEAIDRNSIEDQAHELIQSRSRIEAGYKTNQTYLDDARTLLFEALTASGHLSKVEISGPLQEIHKSMISVLLNSFSDSLPAHEKRRRFQEICEELTLQAIELKMVSGRMSFNRQIATISDYIVPGTLSEKSAQSIGYRPYNKKGMVRSTSLHKNQDGTYTRVTEQVSRSNSNAQMSKTFLETNGVIVNTAQYADVAVLGTQFMHDMSEGVVGLMRRLDQHQGESIRYGEPISDDQASYEDVRQVSAQREMIAHGYVQQLAELTQLLDKRLEDGLITRRQHNNTFKEQVGNILRAICVMDPSYAVDCFGEKARGGFVEAGHLVATGDFIGAENILLKNQSFEQTPSFCGMSLTKDEADQLGINIDSMSNLLKMGKESWKWSKGVCRVEQCPTRPGKTKVGPCSVCEGCQYEYDRGNDPTRVYRKLRKFGTKVVKKTTKPLDELKKQKNVRQ